MPTATTRYELVIENDSDHSVQYVTWLLNRFFRYSPDHAAAITVAIHHRGSMAVWSGHLELAELKLQQVLEASADPITGCQSPLVAYIRPETPK